MINKAGEEKKAVIVDSKEFAKENALTILYDEESSKLKIRTWTVNRPGLILAGFDGFFASSRIQIVGSAEVAYLKSLDMETRLKRVDNFFSTGIPCVVLSRGFYPGDEYLALAKKYKCPVYSSIKSTSECVNDITHYLNEILAEDIDIHGELLDISGIGVLITGENGIGKSETALELVHRGHMLVADDRVIIKKIKDKLMGTAPKSIRNLLEVRGVGIIDVEDMYGISGVLEEKQIGLNVELVKWTENCDRLGDEIAYIDILGVYIPKISIPVIAGRNLAIVIEAATKSMCLKSVGKNPVDNIIKSMQNVNSRQFD